MKMKAALTLLGAMALFAGSAQAAATEQTFIGAGSYDIVGTSPATVTQNITVTVPQRYGLYLHRTTWNLNLGQIGSEVGGPACYRAGEHDTSTGRDALYDISALMGQTKFNGDSGPDDSSNPYDVTATINQRSDIIRSLVFPAQTNFSGGAQVGGSNTADFVSTPVSSYPGLEIGEGGVLWKGPIMCVYQKIVEKFSNSTSWAFTAQLNAQPGFPTMYVADHLTDVAAVSNSPAITVRPVIDGGLANSNGVRLTGPNDLGLPHTLLFSTTTTTGGWLDDNLLEALVFDGSEVAGTYNGTVTYRLTDTTAPIISALK